MSTDVKESISSLTKLSNDNFLALFNSAIKILEKDNIRKERSPLLHDINTCRDSEVEDAEKLCNALESIIQENTTIDEMQTTLLSNGLQKDRASLLASQVDQLKDLIARRNLCCNPREELVDLQWKFGVVAGGSAEEETGRTFVQVKIVSRSQDNITSSQHIEMSLEKFYDFLHQLEKAKASLEYIKYL